MFVLLSRCHMRMSTKLFYIQEGTTLLSVVEEFYESLFELAEHHSYALVAAGGQRRVGHAVDRVVAGLPPRPRLAGGTS